MVGRESRAVVEGFRTLFGVGTASSTSDEQLIERFVGGGEDAAESAFAALVERHGPMVLRVCRGVLRDSHQAEDAFQAAFLILARKAGSIRTSASVASWLFGVARRVALRAKADRARRDALERRGAAMLDETGRIGIGEPPEFLPEVQDEVARLPEKYRAPILLCYFEGLTHEEAAGQLHLPVGTVKVRLSRARDRLRGRLVRIGLAPTLVAGVVTKDASGAVPSMLAEATIKAAARVAAGRAAGVSAPVASLVDGVLRAMFLTKLKALAALAAVGLTLVVASTSASSRPDRPAPAAEAREGVVVLKKADFSIKSHQAGTVHPFESINVTPKFSGYLKSLNVDIGDSVKRGQVVAEIDAPELVLDAEKAKTVVDQARAKLLTAKAGVDVARASMDAKSAMAEASAAALRRFESLQTEQEKVSRRVKELVERGAIEERMADEAAGKVETSRSAVAEAKAQVSVAKAGIEEGKAKVQAAESGIGEAEADLKVALAELRKAEVQRESTVIRSPIDGVVTRRTPHQGDFVRSGAEANSAPMLTIVNADKVRVVVLVPDSDVPMLDKGDRVAVRIDAIPDRVFEGTISRTAYAEDPANRTLRAEIDLNNADGKLRPGQFGRVSITLETVADCLMLPDQAITTDPADPGKTFCARIVDGREVRTPIKLGRSNGESHVVLDGLKEGDAVWLGGYGGGPRTEPGQQPRPAAKK